ISAFRVEWQFDGFKFGSGMNWPMMSKTDGVVLMQRTRTNTRTQMPDWRAAANRSQRATEMEFTQVCTAHSSTPK
ncbi:MAG: hypothetical protein VYE53_13960, partial [Planctomycetota bacterium]|nr:hypothetical protein [Planctomycetota bacterium]